MIFSFQEVSPGVLRNFGTFDSQLTKVAKKYDDLPRTTTINDDVDLESVLRNYPATRTVVRYVCWRCGAQVEKSIQYLRKYPKLLCRECINEEKTGVRNPSSQGKGRKARLEDSPFHDHDVQEKARAARIGKKRKRKIKKYRYGDEEFEDKGGLAIRVWKKDFRGDSSVDPKAAIDYVEATYGPKYLDGLKR